MMSHIFGLLFRISPRLKHPLYRGMYEHLVGRYHDADWPFMNYGYADLDPTAPPLELYGPDQKHRYGIQLYHHVADAVDLRGRDVLEIGCGRGGGASYLIRSREPNTVVGLDFSEKAVRYCARHHRMRGLHFIAGDAESLPCTDEAFDVVINIESSHCYGSMARFLAEIWRVLRPGGYLLFADVRPSGALPTLHAQVQSSGLDVVNHESITLQVCKALELDSERKEAVIRAAVPQAFQPFIRNFVRLRGTPAYRALLKGQTAYIHYVAQKRSKESILSGGWVKSSLDTSRMKWYQVKIRPLLSS